MKVTRSGSPLGDSTEANEPLDPQETQRASRIGRSDRAAETDPSPPASSIESSRQTSIEATRAELTKTANETDFSDVTAVDDAVRRSARWITRSRLGEKYRGSKQAEQVVHGLGEQVASDPSLKAKLLSILTRIKSENDSERRKN